MSIPLLISQTRPQNTYWALKSPMYARIFYGICVALNLFVSSAIVARIYMMRQKVKKLQADFYLGFVTILVESGAFFTLWGLTYVILMAGDIDEKEIFLLPYTQILGITRMLIILRMAQGRAWSLELARTISGGASEWQSSLTHSIPLYDVPASAHSSLPQQRLNSKRETYEFDLSDL
ncbi:hypothetical protein H0H81_005071 [Sphagnurus paluster]|uniref:Uncharacterized protein n=1 Tax=Sphagnurus paluster TaxID=117069 RepID=A0A9P7KJA5_9AGAR|nr:hypothetical protein H0H81_005071 [Sphagnurus paluster]